MRKAINEIKEIMKNMAVVAKEENMTILEAASLMQTGAALSGNDRMIGLIAIAKKRVIV